jgi:hypothetical protein
MLSTYAAKTLSWRTCFTSISYAFFRREYKISMVSEKATNSLSRRRVYTSAFSLDELVVVRLTTFSFRRMRLLRRQIFEATRARIGLFATKIKQILKFNV